MTRTSGQITRCLGVEEEEKSRKRDVAWSRRDRPKGNSANFPSPGRAELTTNVHPFPMEVMKNTGAIPGGENHPALFSYLISSEIDKYGKSDFGFCESDCEGLKTVINSPTPPGIYCDLQINMYV